MIDLIIAKEKDIPLIEIPQNISTRTLSVDDTREALVNLGVR